MKKWEIKVTKITDENLLHIANSFTSGKESKQSLKSAYRHMHSTIRTQIFLVECYDIPQYVSYHLRTHFSLFPTTPVEYGWMQSKRIDKGGADFREVCELLTDRIGNAWSKDLPSEMLDCRNEIANLPDKFERFAPTNFCFMISAEGLMNMCHKRLCIGAVSKETREVVEDVVAAVDKVDSALTPYLVKPCVHQGFCREYKCCGFQRTELFKKIRENYLKNFLR